MRFTALRTFFGLSLLGLVLAASAPARAITIPINFQGTEQHFSASIDLSGNLHAEGNGSAWNSQQKVFEPYTLTSPFDHSLGLFGPPLHLSSDPKTYPLGTTFDLKADSLVGIHDLDIDFLSGQSLDFTIDTVKITTNSKVALINALLGQVDLSGTLSEFRFDQTGIASVTGSAKTGTFAVSGNFGATISNLNLIFGGLLLVPIDDQAVSLPGALTGTWKLTGPLNAQKVSLDGSLSLDVPLALITNLTTSNTDIFTLTMSTTLDMAGSLNVTFNYHLEDIQPLAPEPGSIVLLGIGLCAAVVPLARRLRRK